MITKTNYYVYRYTCIPNGKLYFGVTCDLERRHRQHFSSDSNCIKFSNAIKKYGEGAFSREIILETPDKERAAVTETALIEQYNTIEDGYNLKTSGYLGRLGQETRQKISAANKKRKVSFETRLKMSKAAKLRSRSAEARRKVSEAHKGKSRSMKTRQRISETLKGRSPTAETRLKISKSLKGRPRSEDTKRKISESHKGLTPSDETRTKMSEAKKGKMRQRSCC